jgi:hypothetical protein
MASEFTCELCGQVCPTEAEMRTHRLIVHVEGEVSCMFCDLCGISPDEMTYHINTAHSDELVNSLPVSGLVDQHAGKHYDAVSKVDKPLDAETNHLSDTLLDTGHGHQNKCNRRRTLLYDRTKCSLDVHRNDETAEEGNARKRQRHASDSQKSLGDGEEQLNELSQCPLCGLLSESAAVLQVHVAEDHNDLETKPVQDEKNFERRSLCCPVCSLRCDSRFHLELHVAQHFQESSSSASTTSVAGKFWSMFAAKPICDPTPFAKERWSFTKNTVNLREHMNSTRQMCVTVYTFYMVVYRVIGLLQYAVC